MTSNNELSHLELIVYKLMYCGFTALIKGTNKIVYCAQYPAFKGTSKPDFNVPSTEEELTPDSHITRDTFANFITSSDVRQVDGKWKGGRWGTNNFTLTGTKWLPTLYVGDTLSISVVKEGIVKYNGQPFTDNSTILPNTEINALSCNAHWDSMVYPLYMTDNPMPQYAIDTLFMWVRPNPDNNLLLLKCMRRGEGPNVDSPHTIIPAGGEHLQPENDTDRRQQALFSINEEIGIPPETVSQCYFLSLGTFNDEGRDSRYYKYSALQDGEIVYFGVNRFSSTDASILLLVSEDDVEPKEVTPEDTTEINSKWWENVYTFLSKHPDEEWMLKDHQKFIPLAIQKVEEFLTLQHQERELLKF